MPTLTGKRYLQSAGVLAVLVLVPASAFAQSQLGVCAASGTRPWVWGMAGISGGLIALQQEVKPGPAYLYESASGALARVGGGVDLGHSSWRAVIDFGLSQRSFDEVADPGTRTHSDDAGTATYRYWTVGALHSGQVTARWCSRASFGAGKYLVRYGPSSGESLGLFGGLGLEWAATDRDFLGFEFRFNASENSFRLPVAATTINVGEALAVYRHRF